MSRFIFSTQNTDGSTSLFSSDGSTAGTVDLNVAAVGLTGAQDLLFDFTDFNGKTFFAANTITAGGPEQLIIDTDGTVAGTQAVTTTAVGGPFGVSAIGTVGDTLLLSGRMEFGMPGLFAYANGTALDEIATGVSTSAITVSHGVGWFAGNDGGLWRTDGTAAGTYAITPAGASLDPGSITQVADGKTVFINQPAGGGAGALWVTDGTAAGTHQLADAALGTHLEFGGAETNGKAIFTAVDAADDISVWATDGTASGTTEVRVNGPANAPIRTPGGYVSANGKVFFSSGYGLCATDGTEAGTVSLTSLSPDSDVASGDKLFFVQQVLGSGGVFQEQLFVTDGTTNGTIQLSVAGLQLLQDGGSITAVEGGVVFEGTDTSGKQALFASDGTSAGSHELTLPAGIPISAATVIAALPDAVAPAVVTLGGGAQFYQVAAGATVQAGSGSDTILASAGSVTVDGGAGKLLFVGGSGASSVVGGSGSATIFTGAGGGSFAGGSAGHNIFISQTASGGVTLTGGGAGDEIFASAGPTTFNGGPGGNDVIVGDTGTLDVNAQEGDAVFGGAGSLSVSASASGADSIVGGAGALTVAGRGGNMLVVAGASTSNIAVGSGASLIFAGSGSSTITGGAGSLQAVLGSGTASFSEGSGPSVYDVIRGAAGGTDVLYGFKPSTDKIELFGYRSADQHITTSGGSTVLSLVDGTRITLVGVTDPGGSIFG